ncbi:MAG TPA: ribokinase [Bacillota bacterium]|nr:ribokinase [Bacillota bacterium]HOK69508.1 ribokinase [Bacillota bacterium]HPP85587.1 ribokinase [Bacillota bacterium]
MKKPKILVVGSLVMDLIVSTERFPNSGETVFGCDFHTAPGGKGANQAVQAAKLGADVTMVGKVGDDSFGEILLASLNSHNVNTQFIKKAAGVSTAVGNIILEKKNNTTHNRIIVVPGANMKITPEDVAFLEDEVARYDMVMLQLEIPMQINEIVAEYAYKKGVPVMLNSAPSAPLSQALLSCLTYISPNEHEAQDITGICPNSEENIRKAADRLIEMGVQNALITLGSKGAVFVNKDVFLKSPCIDSGSPVDPTAAGDSFVGAFCTAVCLGADYESALRFANCAAGITVTRMGAQPSLPSIDEVLRVMQTNRLNTELFEQLRD